MDGSTVALFLLLMIMGGLALSRLQRRLEGTERRLREIDRELDRLRGGGADEEAADRVAARRDAAAPAATEPAPTPAVAPPAEPREAAASPPLEPPAETAPLTPAAPAAPAAAGAPRQVPPALSSAAEAAEPEPLPVGPPQEPPSQEAGAAPAAAEGPVEPPPPPPRRRVEIDWERWVGVRGAAVLGGAVLALAAILFLKFSIERGLVPPVVRVAVGVVTGLGALGGAELLRRRAYGATANALSGAGIVILYASVWAAHRLYELIPVPLAFLFLVLVTAACGLLSWRYGSLVIATLGLVGGFATPFMLASERFDPIGLFGYILLLDVGLLALSGKRGWPLLSHLALAGTLLYQGIWVFDQMRPGGLQVTLVVLAVFALLFAVAAGLRPPADEERRQRRFTAVAGVSLPFAFAAYLAARADLGEHVWPVAVLLLLLSAAACWMARVHRLPLLAPAAAAAGVAVIGVWAVRTEFDAATTWEAVGVSAALALLFRLSSSRLAGARGEPNDLATPVAAGGLLLVLLGAAMTAPVGRLWPWLVGWLVPSYLLAEQAGAAAAGDRRRLLAPLAAAGEVVAVGVWLIGRPASSLLAWEVVAVAVALALFYHLVVPEAAAGGRRWFVVDGLTSAPFVAAAGFLWLLCLTPPLVPASPIWPWLAGWLVAAGLLFGRGGTAGRGYRQVVAASLLGFAFVVYYLARGLFEAPPRAAVFFGLALALALILQALALSRRAGPAGRAAEGAAAVYPMLLLFGLQLDAHNAYLPAVLFLAVGLFLAGLVALAATRLAAGQLYLGAVALLALVHFTWTAGATELAGDAGLALAALGVQAAAVALFSLWPYVVGPRLAGRRWALYAAALAGPLWFPALRRLYELRFGEGAIGLLPVLLAMLALVAALLARRLWAAAPAERRRALVWHLAVALGFVSVAIPLQLEKEWITVGWALEGLALIALWKRLDHPGLKVLGLALLGAVTVRLLLNPAVFGYYPRSGRPIFNWLMYTYLVPAAALLGSARVLAGLEIERLSGREASLYGAFGGRPLGAMGCGLAAILTGFWWINLAVIDAFSRGARLDLTFERLPARDLSLSLSWALYALLLLAVGMARRSVGLRWLSLGFLILTIGKVFLYDLGQLRDLYRVASLVGLAVSLLVVSLAYQRFVFGSDREAERTDPP